MGAWEYYPHTHFVLMYKENRFGVVFAQRTNLSPEWQIKKTEMCVLGVGGGGEMIGNQPHKVRTHQAQTSRLKQGRAWPWGAGLAIGRMHQLRSNHPPSQK